jgi:predicted TIM-barrel fold metal-dependent hydrolase
MDYVGNSGDSHVLEPDDLWERNLPPSLRSRAIFPREANRGVQEIYLDQKVIRRNAPDMLDLTRPPGAFEPAPRLLDMDEQGVWAEVLYPSNGLWISLCTDPGLESELVKVYNDWLLDTFVRMSPRLVGVAIVPILDVDLAIAEARRAYELGYRALMLTIQPPDHARSTGRSGTPSRNSTSRSASTSGPVATRWSSGTPAPP